MKTRVPAIIALAFCGLLHEGFSEDLTYTNEATFIADLEALGYVWVWESFEDDDVWGDARSTVLDGTMSLPAVTNYILWLPNNPDSELTTSTGPPHSGSWGFYEIPHGYYLTGTNCNTPGNCTDGFVGTSTIPIYALGGWFKGIYGSKLALYLDSDLTNEIAFPEACDTNGENCVSPEILGSAHEFFGVIRTQGFQRFEFRELEGKQEDAKYIWADDFTIGLEQAPMPYMMAIASSNGSISFSCDRLAVQAEYTVECNTNLCTTNWVAITNFTAEGTQTNSIIVAPDLVSAYYRLYSPTN